MQRDPYFYKSIDKPICCIVCALAVFSILIIGSAGAGDNFFSRSVITQGAAYIIGFIACAVIIRYPYTVYRNLGKLLYILSVILLLTVYVPGLGIEVYGAKSWIDLKVITIQPSEIVKILFILFMAGYLDTHRDELYDFKGLIKAGLVAAPVIVIVLKEDLGSALVFASIWLFMLFFSGIRMKVLGQFFFIVLCMVPLAYIFLADYQKERIESFLHPDNLSIGANYQVWQSKVAIGSGGFFGKGLFQGTQKNLDFIPVQTSDFIFSVIGEELGFVGGLIVILLFLGLFLRLLHILREAADNYAALVIAGIIGMFAFQVFENIAMTMGLMPVTGITLPFLSYGGSSIVSNMMGIGLALAIGSRGREIRF